MSRGAPVALELGPSMAASLTKFVRKFSVRKEYNKVEDLYDTRIPLHNEEAFQHGIQFKAKFIGSLEIAKPTCKIDIITAMRRIRYEYKVKGIRKVRSNINISTSGVKITKRKRKRSRKKYSEEQLFVMHHPIYRIFYVSHDSQDLKIFSYITREVPDNTFRCNVFKAYKKGMALTIVRSLGQAFDVCHKLNPKPQKKKKEVDVGSETAEAPQEQEEAKKENADTEGKKEDATPAGVPSTWKQFNTDLDAVIDKTPGETDKKISDLNSDLMQLNFDPFTTPGTLAPQNMPVANGSTVHMDPFQSNAATRNDSGAVTHPPLTVSNLSTNLPDFPDGVDPATASANVLPPHLALLGRPRPRPSLSGQQQVTENMCTDPNQSWTGKESPVSIGEALDGTTHHQRNLSNPFQQEERKQFSAQLALMKEQLDSEKAARIESQGRVEHLLNQNKELLAHLQKMMVQMSQLQAIQPIPQPPQTTPISNTNPTNQNTSSAIGTVSPVGTTPLQAGGLPLPTMTSTPTLTTEVKTARGSDGNLPPAADDMTLGIDLNMLASTATNDPFLPQTSNAQPVSS